ncbi:MAG TPA: hypothetical protein DCS48_12325 [Desulfovibrio sp.]|nr:hypothetical protein [Desulfovibrio sp.]
MLLEFSVANFRSIGEEQTLYMQPAFKSKDEDHNILETGIRREPQALPVVAILGANASGKSNILKAMSFLKEILSDSASRQKNDLYDDYRFKLNAEYKEKPTSFNIKFLDRDSQEDTSYILEYELTLLPSKIVKEKLSSVSSIKGARKKTLIDRSEKKISLHSSIYRKKNFLEVWKADINNQQTALAYLGNKGEIDIFNPVLYWFRNYNFISPTTEPTFFTSGYVEDGIINKAEILNLLNSVDINIEDLNILPRESILPQELNDTFDSLLAKTIEHYDIEESIIYEYKQLRAEFIHTSTSGHNILFDLQKDESEGTKTLYAISGRIILSLTLGSPLAVDELDSSLHPYLIRKIIQLFTNKKTNPKGAQLIFTTHDVTVMDKSLLRPDEIYFTEKDKETFETKLYSLAEFKGMGSVSKNDRGEKLYKDYLNGRFGAVPEVDWEGGI